MPPSCDDSTTGFRGLQPMRAVFEDAPHSPSKRYVVLDSIVESLEPSVPVHLEADAPVGIRPCHPVRREFLDPRLNDPAHDYLRDIDIVERSELRLRETEAHVPIGFAGSTVCSATVQHLSHTTWTTSVGP